jgi:LysM repeat protein
LANSEFPLPNSRNLQKDVDRLSAENQLLKKELLTLTNQLEAQAALARSRPEPVAAVAPPEATRLSAGPTAARPHVYVVKAHETFSSIAAQYGMRTSALLSANPQISPKHLRVGQSLNLP